MLCIKKRVAGDVTTEVSVQPRLRALLDGLGAYLRFLNSSEGKESKVLKGKISGGNSITQELNAEFEFCLKPTFVTLELKLDDRTLVSSARWISTESLELSPRKRDVQRIKESNGSMV